MLRPLPSFVKVLLGKQVADNEIDTVASCRSGNGRGKINTKGNAAKGKEGKGLA